MAADPRYDGRVLLVAVVLTAVCIAVTAGALSGHGPGAGATLPPTPAAPTPPITLTPAATSPSDSPLTHDVGRQRQWRDVVRGLSARRVTAFTTGDVAMLRSVYAPHSRAGRRDLALLRSMLGRGQQVAHLQVRVGDVAVRSRQGTRRVRLLVSDVVSAYVLRGRDGDLVDRHPRVRGTWAMTLVETSAGWRVGSVARA
jgi:hypothetical protein